MVIQYTHGSFFIDPGMLGNIVASRRSGTKWRACKGAVGRHPALLLSYVASTWYYLEAEKKDNSSALKDFIKARTVPVSVISVSVPWGACAATRMDTCAKSLTSRLGCVWRTRVSVATGWCVRLGQSSLFHPSLSRHATRGLSKLKRITAVART